MCFSLQEFLSDMSSHAVTSGQPSEGNWEMCRLWGRVGVAFEMPDVSVLPRTGTPNPETPSSKVPSVTGARTRPILARGHRGSVSGGGGFASLQAAPAGASPHPHPPPFGDSGSLQGVTLPGCRLTS